ncbi:hypothetical protein L218DRAFT_1003250 [Marasmius fiardii PR-910]|nr:hypothetical protein L218DRAFT_1003250 [Marasmius fiardii PR-910]
MFFSHTLLDTSITDVEFSVIKNKISTFSQTSKFLRNSLDDISVKYAFIQAAVLAFKKGNELELTRREHDDRVLALNVMMCDMMSVLNLLKEIEAPNEEYNGLTLEECLNDQMNMVVQTITECAKACDTYQRKHVAIKFFTNHKWQLHFSELAERFIQHQDTIQTKLQPYLPPGTNTTVPNFGQKIRNISIIMDLVFKQMRPAKDREFAAFIQSKGGLTGASIDHLLRDVIKLEQQKQRDEKKQQRDEKANVRRAQQTVGVPMELKKFREEIKKDISTVLRENEANFEQQFEAIELCLKDVIRTVHHESDRVIAVFRDMNKGPYDRILDKDVYNVWREMGWKGIVKATYLVMALHDHFLEVHQKNYSAASAEDLWLLQFITISRIQPLIEAFDEDGSSLITVNEVNAFTKSRPEGWSLPKWIAYWTIGFEMTTHWYYQRICQLLSFISHSSKKVLPANQRAVSKFMQHWTILCLQYQLSGLQKIDYWKSTDWSNDKTFLKFKDWILQTEHKMEEYLNTMRYSIDQDNILNIVTGGGRPEKYMMPILYLLLKKSYSMVEKGCTVVLDLKSLETPLTSMEIVYEAIFERVYKLQAIYILQNIKKEEKLSSIFFGLYSYVLKSPEKGEFWMRSMDAYNAMPEEPTSTLIAKSEQEPDSQEPLLEELDSDICWSLESSLSLTSSLPQTAPSLIGAWSSTEDGLISLSITQHTSSDNQFHGSGIDSFGLFSISGCLNGDQILFLKTYKSQGQLFDLEQTTSQYRGLLQEDQTRISGKWSYPEKSLVEGNTNDLEGDSNMNQDPKGSPDGDTSSLGPTLTGHYSDSSNENSPDSTNIVEDLVDGNSVTEGGSNGNSDGDSEDILRRPVDYYLFCPTDEDFQKSQPQARWALVRNAVKYWAKKRHLSWKTIQERRDKRNLYFKLLDMVLRDMDFDDDEYEEKMVEILESVHPSDLHFWRNIYQFKYRREPIHM